MSSEGPKIGEGRYGSAWNGRKTKKTSDPRWRQAVKFGRRGRLTLPFLPGWRVFKDGGWNRLPQPKPDWSENGSKRPSAESTGLREFF